MKQFLDGYMNIALEQTEEYVNGQLKKKYGDGEMLETFHQYYIPTRKYK